MEGAPTRSGTSLSLSDRSTAIVLVGLLVDRSYCAFHQQCPFYSVVLACIRSLAELRFEECVGEKTLISAASLRIGS